MKTCLHVRITLVNLLSSQMNVTDDRAPPHRQLPWLESWVRQWCAQSYALKASEVRSIIF